MPGAKQIPAAIILTGMLTIGDPLHTTHRHNLLAILNQIFDLKMPDPNAEFIFFGILGGITQIIATALLVYLFSFRNFAVGTAYSQKQLRQLFLVS